MGSGKKQTIGYQYCLGMHLVLAHGVADRLVRLSFDGKDAWKGESTGGEIFLSAPELFGGESREGGVAGVVDFEPGAPTQQPNAYLQSQLGADLPGHRGVIGLVLRGGAMSPASVCKDNELAKFAPYRQFYFGMNPYLKTPSGRIQRILKTTAGEAQWYPEKAVIKALGTEAEVVSDSSGYYEHTQESPGLVGWGSYPVPAMSGTLEEIAAAAVKARNDYYRDTSGGTTYQYVYMHSYYYFADLDEVHAVGNAVDAIGDSPEPDTEEYWQYNEEVGIAGVGLVVPRCCVAGGAAAIDPVTFEVTCTAQVVTTNDMNPAHIIRECLTDPVWGMGYSTAEIDGPAFMAAADQLYAEGMGMSLLWDRQMKLEDFIEEVCRHIDATLYVDPASGLFTLKLIRDDYNPATLPVLGPSTIESLADFGRPGFDELINTVTVQYWNTTTGQDASLTVQDIALLHRQGAEVGQTVNYPGFTNPTIAARAAQRDLQALSAPLASCTLIAHRAAAGALRQGDPFKLTWPAYGLSEAIMRVTDIAYGDGVNNRVRIRATQDAFALPTTLLIPPVTPAWVDPAAPPIPLTRRLAFELPYLEAVQLQGQATVDSVLATDPAIGYVGAAAGREQAATINARLLTDAGAGAEDVGAVDFCPFATLAADINQTAETFAISGVEDLEAITLGTWVQLDAEIMAVVAIAADSITVKRGVLDTVPATHAAGATLFFWDEYSGADPTEYVSGETITVALLPTNGGATLALADVTSDQVTIVGRAARPYPPGNFKVNGAYFPVTIGANAELALTWVHRDRTQQTGGALLGFTDAGVGPEAGTTYTVRVYGETDALVHTESGLTGTAYVYPLITEKAESGLSLTAGGDPYFDWVVLGLHMDGTDGSTTFTDIKGHTFTAYGNAQIDTAQSKYGGASAYFDGSGDYISTPDSADFSLGSGDFTIEFWYRPTVATTNTLIGQRTNSTTFNGFGIAHRATGTLGSSLTLDGSTYAIDLTSAAILTAGNWYHIALVRHGDVFTQYVNGMADGSTTRSGTLYDSPAALHIGADLDGARGVNGHIDDVRITKGVARYTANFTPPAAPFPDYGEQRQNGRLRVELEAVRDGLASYQHQEHTVERPGYGFNYGKYYGGQ